MPAMSESQGAAAGEAEAGAPAPKWRKAKTPRIAAEATAEEALTRIIIGATEHLRANEACVLRRAHQEGVHQMRVAARRLRSALTLYRPYLPSDQYGYLDGELKWLIRELGGARDWDVFVDGILQPVLDAVPGEAALRRLTKAVDEMRAEAYTRAGAAITAQRYAGLILLLRAWAEGRRWHDGASDEQSAAMRAPAVELARELFEQRYVETLGMAGDFAALAAEDRHAVRIQVKKLRYATDFFGTLFARRQVTPMLAAMKAVQDQLGLNNDIEVARKLLKKVPKRAHGRERRQLAFAAGVVFGWHSHVSGHREQGAIRAWERFVAKRPFWRPAEAAPTDGSSPSPKASPAPRDEPAETGAHQVRAAPS